MESEAKSKEQINERSSATESAAAMDEDGENSAADAEAADRPDLQVNNCVLSLASQRQFILRIHSK